MAMAMAFQFERVPAADVSPQLVSTFPTASRLIRLADDRFPAMTP